MMVSDLVTDRLTEEVNALNLLGSLCGRRHLHSGIYLMRDTGLTKVEVVGTTYMRGLINVGQSEEYQQFRQRDI